MAKLSELHSGSRTQIRLGMIPQSYLSLDPIPRPPDVTVTLGAAVATNATTATVTALTGPIARGSTLFFTSGAAPFALRGVLRLTEDAPQGATTLSVAQAPNAIANGSIADHKGMICVRGLTSAGFSIANQEQSSSEIICNEDAQDGALSGYTEGSVNSASWSAPLSGNVRDNTPGYQMIKIAAATAATGVYVYFEHEVQALGGTSKSSTDSGVAQFTSFESTSSADGFVTFSASLAGRGAPTLSAIVV